LARDPSDIRLGELLEAIEGPDLFNRCLFWGRRCGDRNPCLLHAGWREIKPHLTEFIETVTLGELAKNGGADARAV
jgi:DNA-binding IscR family transcriptional regulator